MTTTTSLASYPAPIGVVAASEPLSHFAGALTTGSSISRIHFPLTVAQTLPSARVRLVAHFVWGWFDGGKGFGTHTFQVRINGTVLGTQTLTYAAPLIIEAPASALNTGANTLHIQRINAPIPYAGISFDALSFEVHPTGMSDTDGDGLPNYWEQNQGLSDANPADAAQDLDQDNLSNLQEFALNTDPRLFDTDADGLSDSQETTTHPLQADTDGDGLTDGAELAQSPPLNPNAIDSDGDGAPDSWEIATGFSATSNSSTPPPSPCTATAMTSVRKRSSAVTLSPPAPPPQKMPAEMSKTRCSTCSSTPTPPPLSAVSSFSSSSRITPPPPTCSASPRCSSTMAWVCVATSAP